MLSFVGKERESVLLWAYQNPVMLLLFLMLDLTSGVWQLSV